MKNILVLLTAITLFSSCGKDGATGPQGPQGIPGSSNVSSFIYDVSSWVYNSTVPEFNTNLPVPEITSDVINGGTVQVFEGNASSGSSIWYSMPYSYTGIEHSYSISLGNVEVEFTRSDGTVPTTPGAYQFKVVVIPPAIVKKHPNTNWNNYKELMNALGQENK